MHHATIHTTKWPIRFTLETDKTPFTVTNFVTLAQWWFYDNLIFHRVIEDFMIQTWCPQWTGTWWPGYQFADEFHEDLEHDGPWVLSMANSWPDTNGSQFFITHVATPRLDEKHTVFWRVIDQTDQTIVDAITQWDSIISIQIHEIDLPVQTSEFADEIDEILQNK